MNNKTYDLGNGKIFIPNSNGLDKITSPFKVITSDKCSNKEFKYVPEEKEDKGSTISP